MAGAMPHTPVSPQYPPWACFSVRLKTSFISSLEIFREPSFFIAAINAPPAIKACWQPSMGRPGWLIINSAISRVSLVDKDKIENDLVTDYTPV